MTAWLVAVMPTRLPAATRATMARAAVLVLPEPGGPCTARYDPSRPPARRTTASAAVSSGWRSGAPAGAPTTRGGRRRQQLPGRRERAGAVDPVPQQGGADVAQRRPLGVGADGTGGDQRPRVVERGRARPAQHQRPGGAVDVDEVDAAEAHRLPTQLGRLHRGVDDGRAAPELVLLVGIEPVGPVQGLLHADRLPDGFEAGDGLGVGEEIGLLGPQHPVEVPPPLGLVLALVPVEQVGHEPAGADVGGVARASAARPARRGGGPRGRRRPPGPRPPPVRVRCSGAPPVGGRRRQQRGRRAGGPRASRAGATSTRRRRGCRSRCRRGSAASPHCSQRSYSTMLEPASVMAAVRGGM